MDGQTRLLLNIMQARMSVKTICPFSQTFSLVLHSTTEFFVFRRRPEFPGRNVVFNKTIAGRRRTLLLNLSLSFLPNFESAEAASRISHPLLKFQRRHKEDDIM